MVWWLDRYDREPLHLVAMVFLWGASAAPLASVTAFPLLEAVVGGIEPSPRIALISIGLLTPLVEEVGKALGVVLVVVLSSKFDNPTDGVVYGTAAGLGFAVTENMIYGTGTGAHLSSLGGILMLVIGRTLLSAGVHAVCSATFGGFLGHAILSGRKISKVVWTSTGLAIAVSMHGAWNLALLRFGPVGEDGTPRLWILALPVLYLLYVGALALFVHSEHRILKRQLADEVELAMVPSWVEDVIPYYRRRVRGNWWPSRSERTIISRLLTRVAFRKHAIQRLPAADAAIASLEIVKLRQRLREILDPEDPEPS
jgi:RsiW-degrading membrane proteinase PrsW (M82 family)